MGKEKVEVCVCDKCGFITLDKDLLYKCIHCGKDVCSGVDCSYSIAVTVVHNIPNGIPFLWTRSRYRICHDCHILDQLLCDELQELIQPKKNCKLYRHGTRHELEWVRIN